MTIMIMLSVLVGILMGVFLIPGEWLKFTDGILDIGLCVLLLLVGIDIGKQKNVLQEIKKMGVSILIVPIMIALGSVVGGMFSGVLLQIPLNEAGALGAGLGWYTLSSVLLLDYSSELAALAFLTNVFRELLAIIMIPFIAKYIGYMEVVAPPAATAMDTTLPIITKYSDSKTAVLGFVSGVVLSSLVPVLVPFILAL